VREPAGNPERAFSFPEVDVVAQLESAATEDRVGPKSPLSQTGDASIRPDVNVYSHRATFVGRDGRLRFDPNPKLQMVNERMHVYEDMQSDPMLANLIGLLLEAVRHTTFEVDPAGSRPKAKRIADFTRMILGLDGRRGYMDRPLAVAVRPMLSAAWMGFKYSEIMWGLQRISTGPGAGLRLVLRDLLECEQVAHDRWILDDDGQRLVGVTQRPPVAMGRPILSRAPANGSSTIRQGLLTGAGLRHMIPADKLVLSRYQGEGLNFEGRGLLRSCVHTWRVLTLMVDSMAMATEYWAVPGMVMETDDALLKQMGWKSIEISALLDKVFDSASLYSQGRGKVIMGAPGVKLRVIGERTIDNRMATDAITALQRWMALAFLAQFVSLGMGDVGSRSVGEIHRAVHIRMVGRLMDDICRDITDQVIGPLVVANFGPRAAEDCPSLRHVGVDDGQLSGLVAQIPGLMQVGAIKPTDRFRGLLYKLLAGHAEGERLLEADLEMGPVDVAGTSGAGSFKPGPGRPREEGVADAEGLTAQEDEAL
jgi:hypothetical protein